MAPRQLPQEIWEVILGMLKKPVPAPLSRVPQSEIRQGDLCACMRTCHLFYPICQKLLYTHIVTDAFPLLLSRVPKTLSMRRHLSLTTKLFIEYCPKAEEATYSALLGEGAWTQCGWSFKERQREIRRQCGAELRAFWDSVGWMRGDPEMPPKVFPRLATIAVSSIEGKIDTRWKDYDNHHIKNMTKTFAIDSSKGCFDQLLCALGLYGKLRHLCIRDASGLFSTPSVTMASHVPPVTYTRTCHNPPNVTEADVSLPFGAPIRWTTDNPHSTSWNDIMKSMADTFTDIINIRKQDDGRPRKKTDCADIEIYCSSNMRFGAQSQPYYSPLIM